MSTLTVGPPTDDIWKKRVHGNFKGPFGIQTTTIAHQSTRLKTDEMTERCEDEGRDPSDKLARARAGRMIEKERQRAWMETERDRVDISSGWFDISCLYNKLPD